MNIDRTSWRNRYSDDRYYLTELMAWGYEPSQVEKIIVTEPDTPAEDNTDATDTHEDD